MVVKPDAILIAGPTASGKSKLAIELAKCCGGEIVNADSMQIYPVLRILTARPDAADLAEIPHHLYGYAPLDEPYSASRWLADATHVANGLWSRGVVPVFVGGTGLYFKALDEGLAYTPPIPADIRASIRADLLEHGSDELHSRLGKLDPEGAARLRPSDGQRIARALEVVTASGTPLSDFQSRVSEPPLLAGKSVLRIVLMPERSLLHERINSRTEEMFRSGAREEVMELLSHPLDSDSTVSKAIGVAQVRDYLRGKQNIDVGIDKVKSATRQYAKRQTTWFRGQFDYKWNIFTSAEHALDAAERGSYRLI